MGQPSWNPPKPSIGLPPSSGSFAATPAGSLRRRHLGIDVARNDDRDQRRWNLLGPEGSRNRVLHRRKALQVGGDRLDVVRRQMGKVWPGHDRKQLAAIRHLALGDGGDNLLICPAAEARFLVGGQVAPDKNADARNPESDLGARKRALRVSLAEKSAGRMTAATAGNCHKILTALDRGFGGRGRGHAKNHSRNEQWKTPGSHVPLP